METLIEVKSLWKKYSKNLKASAKYAARDMLKNSFGTSKLSEQLRETEFWALQDISFSVQRGEVLGIMGHNGAGKSTLLKCIAGKLKSDVGEINMKGNLSHLIEMSAGFSPTMTGRSNVRVRGQLLGKRGKDLNVFVDKVAEFADIGEFFDAPVQFYSSGMKSRLGFAASSVLEPDILILDEVLAVGDLPFRLKCYERINELVRNAAVLFVSHSQGQISRLCHRVIYLQKGLAIYDGDAQGALSLYREKMDEKIIKKSNNTLNPDLVSFSLIANGKPKAQECNLSYGDHLKLEINISRVPRDSQIRILLKSMARGVLMDWNSARNNLEWPISANKILADIGSIELSPGSYSFSLQVMSQDGREHLCLSEQFLFRVGGNLMYELPIQRRASWLFVD